MDTGRKVDAIRLLREHTGLGLAAAKAAVEANRLPSGQDNFARNFGDSEPLPPAVIAALAAGKKIEAIRLLRQARGVGLKEAKAMVDAAQPAPVQRGRHAATSLAPGEVGSSRLSSGFLIVAAAVVAVMSWRLLNQG